MSTAIDVSTAYTSVGPKPRTSPAFHQASRELATMRLCPVSPYASNSSASASGSRAVVAVVFRLLPVGGGIRCRVGLAKRLIVTRVSSSAAVRLMCPSIC